MKITLNLSGLGSSQGSSSVLCPASFPVPTLCTFGCVLLAGLLSIFPGLGHNMVSSNYILLGPACCMHRSATGSSTAKSGARHASIFTPLHPYIICYAQEAGPHSPEQRQELLMPPEDWKNVYWVFNLFLLFFIIVNRSEPSIFRDGWSKNPTYKYINMFPKFPSQSQALPIWCSG